MASGTLAQTPLAHLLIHILDRRLTGTLVLEEPTGGKSAIYFDRGLAQKARTSAPVAYLRDVLLDLNLVEIARCDRALHRAAREQKLHGQVLIAEQSLDEAKLRSALREQLHRKVLWMFTLPPQAAFGFYEGTNYLERFGGTDNPHAKTLALIWRGVRGHSDEGAVRAVCSGLGPTAIRLHQEAQLGRFYFDNTERTVVDVLRVRPQSLAELMARDMAPTDLVLRLIYVLAISRQLDLGPAQPPPIGVQGNEESSTRMPVAEPVRSSMPSIPGGPDSAPPDTPPPANWQGRSVSLAPPRARAPQPSSSSPASTSTTLPQPPSAPPKAQPSRAPEKPQTPRANSASSRPSFTPGGVTSAVPPVVFVPNPNDPPELRARKEELVERATSRGQTYYDVLGVAPNAASAQVQAAFFQLAKRFHPDRLGPEFEDVRELAVKAFSRITEAHQILSDTNRRADYDQVLSTGGGSADEQEQVQAVLRATMAFQRAEVLLKKNALEAAEKEARAAVEGDPDQADYEALLAWLEALRSDRSDVTEQISRLSRAIKKEPNNVRARWYRAQLYKRMGRDTLARSDLRHIVEINPNHLDATRELRLYEMRRSSHPPKGAREPGKSVFDKWFKR